ncbi:MAG: hypothetical protein ACJAZO_001128 [Myxococcota bacterium]|jgi:hypothetical protein
MKTTPIIAVLAAGSALSLSACNGKIELTTNPPPPDIQPTENPPAPSQEPMENPPPPQQPSLPSWNDVASSHPEGATNPPIPFLYVTPEGDCYKDFVSPFRASGPDGIGDRVREDCATEACGTQIACPERAQPLMDTYKTRPTRDDEDGTNGG